MSKMLRGVNNVLAVNYFPDRKTLPWHFCRRLVFIVRHPLIHCKIRMPITFFFFALEINNLSKGHFYLDS